MKRYLVLLLALMALAILLLSPATAAAGPQMTMGELGPFLAGTISQGGHDWDLYETVNWTAVAGTGAKPDKGWVRVVVAAVDPNGIVADWTWYRNKWSVSEVQLIEAGYCHWTAPGSQFYWNGEWVGSGDWSCFDADPGGDRLAVWGAQLILFCSEYGGEVRVNYRQ